MASEMPVRKAGTGFRYPAPEPAFGDGKDAFHRVPCIPGEVRDAVERVLTSSKGARCVKVSGSFLHALTNDEVFLEFIDELSPGVLKISGPFRYTAIVEMVRRRRRFFWKEIKRRIPSRKANREEVCFPRIPRLIPPAFGCGLAALRPRADVVELKSASAARLPTVAIPDISGNKKGAVGTAPFAF